ncbi:hypothetical protein EVAR_96549_1 [Eumeta japonica]|uniref:Uncharacterized protein n=1 Tax=Eumeta variegata TaxID=151549 RepID=A0A4C1WDQ6_EUMVA|nr:hypothetical protein EVAR_96549_1 [Eumeta japonica]
MKQFMKALLKQGECFKYLCDKCPSLSEAKLKEGIFDGPDIRKLVKNEDFETKTNFEERETWVSLKKVVKNFLGNKKNLDYVGLVENIQEIEMQHELKSPFPKISLGFLFRKSWRLE